MQDKGRQKNHRGAVLTVVGLIILCAGFGSLSYQKEKRQAERLADGWILRNVSYDPTREMYYELNQAFSRQWEQTTGERVSILMSHGASGSQSQAVIDGLPADVLTLALASDVDAIAAKTGLLPIDWRTRLPHNSMPYVSTLCFLVRKGNPKQIRDWDDLARPDVRVMTPNPQTSGVARWNYLALWGYALRRALGPDFVLALHDPAQAEAVAMAQAQARAFVAAVYGNVPVLDPSARDATNHFRQKHVGDVLINWENEVMLAGLELDPEGLEIVIPSVSMLTEPVVAITARDHEDHGRREIAEAYVEFLYSEAGQDIIGRHYYRPAVSERALARYRDRIPPTELFTIDDVFGGWGEANRTHFAAGGTFDQIWQRR